MPVMRRFSLLEGIEAPYNNALERTAQRLRTYMRYWGGISFVRVSVAPLLNAAVRWQQNDFGCGKGRGHEV